MTELSRRDFLQRLAAAYGGAVISGCSRKGDRFAAERVCIHVLHPGEFIPAPLLEKTAPRSRRNATRDYFNIGLPELIVCESRTRLLDLFQYFWPFSRDDFERLQKAVDIRYQKATIDAALDVAEFAAYLSEHKSKLGRASANAAVLFTFNEFTQPWTPSIVAACRGAAIQEFVVFKDPTEPPYLCDYPAKQKGFKRPPP